MPIDEPDLRDKLAVVEARIQSAVQRCARQRSEITLVAVSKKFSADKILEAYAAGLRNFGENYIQEFADKRSRLAGLDGGCFHLIGHLQSNKAKLASELFQVVQTADSAKLLQRLNGAAEERGVVLEVLLEVKLSTEAAKTGADPESLGGLIKTAEHCRGLRLTGLMTIPPWSEDPEQSRSYFQQLSKLGRQFGLPKLSMGMSADFEVAIEEGATMIRVGTALFGARPKPVIDTVSP